MGSDFERRTMQIQQRTLEELQSIGDNLNRILRILVPPNRATTIKFYVINKGQKEEIRNMFLAQTDKLQPVLEITDVVGAPAKVDGVPKWALSDETLATLTVAADGMSAEIIPGKVAGKFVIQVSADADLGEGVKELLATSEEIEILSGEAVKMDIKLSAPVPQ